MVSYTVAQVRLCKDAIKLHARRGRLVTWDDAAREVGMSVALLSFMRADRKWASWCRDAARELLTEATQGPTP